MAELENIAQIRTNWLKNVSARVAGHPFAQAPNSAQQSPLLELLDGIFHRHFLNPDYSRVKPPLPDLPLLSLDERWIEIRLAPSAPGSYAFDRMQRAMESLEGLSATSSVQKILNNQKSAIFVGEPGSGKSTILKWAARHLIRESRSPSPIPLFVSLRGFAEWLKQNPKGDIYRYYGETQRLRGKRLDDFHDFIMDVEGGAGELKQICYLLLDGWDEVPKSSRREVLLQLERLEWFCPTLLTSRPSGFASTLPRSWENYDVSPLSFESMRALMHEWFIDPAVDQPELEEFLCRHLDQHSGLREMARNPFILTLLCTVVSRRENMSSSTLPITRAELYQKALYLIARYCDEHFRVAGFPFTSKEMRQAESVAFALLQRKEVANYDFHFAQINAIVGDDGQLAATLEKSRLISLTREYDEIYSFLHATIHEFLASQELHVQLRNSQFDFRGIGLDIAWLRVMLFSAGLEPVKPDNRFWELFRWACNQADRFGLLLVRVAHLLAEAKITDGGKTLVGRDIRPELWTLFLNAPDAKPYAEAIVALDPDFAIDQARYFPGNESSFLRNLVLLYQRIPPHHPRRSELIILTASLQLQNLGVVETQESLIDFMGFEPIMAPNLQSAKDVRTLAEILAALSQTANPQQRRTARVRLALTRTEEAEEYLTTKIREVSDTTELEELAEALATLGTLSARDALLEAITRNPENLPLLRSLLQALRGMPIRGGAELLLSLVTPSYPREIRVQAALALACCQSDRVLNLLGDFARMSEPDGEVRKTVLTALAQARAFSMVQELYREQMEMRTEESERMIAWGYLFAIARHIDPSRDFPPHLPMIETLLRHELDKGVLASPFVVSQLSALSHWEEGRKAVVHILDEPSFSLELKIAACRSIREMAIVEAVPRLRATLQFAVDNEAPKLIWEAAQSLAFLAPESILGLSHPLVDKALWLMSQSTGQLLFHDYILDPSMTSPLHSNHEETVGMPKADDTSTSNVTEDIATYNLGDQPWYMQGQIPETVSVAKHLAKEQLSIDFVLVTVTDCELKAVLRLLTPLDGEKAIWEVADRGVYYLGRFGVHVVAVTMCATMGDGRAGGAGRTTMKAIESWNPFAVIMVGIAFGSNPSKQKIGDVLVSEQVAYYGIHAIRGDGKRQQRGSIVPCSEMLLGKFKNALHWTFKRPDEYKCQARFGQVLSGPVLVDNAAFKRELLDHYPTAIGGEMEAAGVMEAARELKVDWFVAKAICDWGEGKTDSHQDLAAAAAASLVFFVLNKPTATDGLKRSKPLQRRSRGGAAGSRGTCGPSVTSWDLANPNRPTKSDEPPEAFAEVSVSVRRSNVPYPRNEYFTGRQDILQNLAQTIEPGVPVAITQAIHGLGGIGKTQTAIEYSYRYSERYTAVLWCRADTADSLRSGYVEIARFLGLPEVELSEEPKIVSAVVQWLGDSGNSGYLLILDNADEPDLLPEFLPRFPKSAQGHILLTSRRDHFKATIKPVSLTFMTVEESVAFLYYRTRRKRITDSKEEKQAAEIAEILGGLPLALEQAAAFIEAKGRTFAAYLREFEIKQGALEDLMLEPELGNYLRFDPKSYEFKEHLTVWTTWEMNFQEVEQSAPDSARILQLSAYLAPDAIPMELVMVAFPAMFANIASEDQFELVFADLMLPLRKYSLASTMETMFSVHRLVQSVLRSRMQPVERGKARSSIINFLNIVMPDPTKFENSARIERLRSHVIACMEWI